MVSRKIHSIEKSLLYRLMRKPLSVFYIASNERKIKLELQFYGYDYNEELFFSPSSNKFLIEFIKLGLLE